MKKRIVLVGCGLAAASRTLLVQNNEAPVVTPAHLYTLHGEVCWRAGNAAKRTFTGTGSAADIHYWITERTGEKLLDKKDTLRTEFWGSAFTGSVGQLVHPFADKISNRIREAKLK